MTYQINYSFLLFAFVNSTSVSYHKTRKRQIGEQIMDWDKLRIFHSVAGAGSLTH
ncbi:MAG: hypothetical protein ACI861_002727, partial [Paracoccaceae bacterium]